MKIKVGVISRSLEFIDLVHATASDNMQVISRQSAYHHAAEVAEELAPLVDIMIARGRIATLMEQIMTIPVINCDYEPIDILTTLSRVPATAYPVALIREESRVGRSLAILGLVERLWGHKVELIVYTDYKSLETQLQSAVVRGIRGVIGGVLEIEMAEQYGLGKTDLVMSKETVSQAIERAELIVTSFNNRKKISAYTTGILRALDGNCILINRLNRIIYVDPTAEKIAGVKINDNAGEVLPGLLTAEHIEQLKKEGQIKNLAMASTDVGADSKLRFDLAALFDHKNNYGGCLLRINTLPENKGEARSTLNKTSTFTTRYSLNDMIGNSQAIAYCKKLVEKFAQSDLNVLIHGETGTGKELFAQSIHQLSQRSSHPFVAVNCAALPSNLLESELFGYEEGAFTGARKGGKKGLFEMADGGTIFLDEIGEAPLEIQSRLLRVLESHEIMRLGGRGQIHVDVRVIAATNKVLENEVQTGTFRSDLFYRLSTLVLDVPALRNRREDITLLAEHFIAEQKLQPSVKTDVAAFVNNLLISHPDYPWPGNIRELRNVVERCTVEYDLYNSGFANPDGIIKPSVITPEPAPSDQGVVARNIKTAEAELISSVGVQVNWNRMQMAEILGISASTLWRKMKKNNITAEKTSIRQHGQAD